MDKTNNLIGFFAVGLPPLSVFSVQDALKNEIATDKFKSTLESLEKNKAPLDISNKSIPNL